MRSFRVAGALAAEFATFCAGCGFRVAAIISEAVAKARPLIFHRPRRHTLQFRAKRNSHARATSLFFSYKLHFSQVTRGIDVRRATWHQAGLKPKDSRCGTRKR